MEKNKPVKECRDSNVRASVFQREAKNNKNGSSFTSRSVALQISHLDKNGVWVNNSITIIKKDFKKVMRALKGVESHLNSRE